jgi:hypothetical protein
MSVNDAAQKLAQRLKGATWLHALGVGREDGNECIFLYVAKDPPKNLLELLETADEFPVVIRKTRVTKPAVY